MMKICNYLEKAFALMNISHKKTINEETIFYQLHFPETGLFGGTVNMTIDKMFSAEIQASVAKGISQNIRSQILEIINELNGEFQFIRITMDKNNDICSCQQFILVGNEEIMCKQIVTNLVAFYDLHRRTAQKLLDELETKNKEL